MASLVLGAVGGWLFGPIGFLGGSLLGNLLFPGKVEGPRLHNLKLQGSDYGRMIPIVYGTMRLAGQVVWQTDLTEHKHTSGGKGGPQVTTYTYTASFAIKVCKGPIAGIVTIWANGEVVYDTTGTYTNVDNGSVPLAIYTGIETALPDPTMESILGVGNVPAFRDDAAVVFTDWDLGNFGNTLPNLTFLVVQQLPPGDLHIIQQNNATGHTFTGLTIMQAWPSDGVSDIIVSGTNDSASKTTAVVNPNDFDPTTFNLVGPDTSTLSYPCYWSGPIIPSLGIGNYVRADGTSTPLWRADAPTTHQLGSGADYLGGNFLYTGTMYGHTVSPGVTYPADDAKFLHNAGVPDGLWLNGTCLSADGTTLYVFTATTNTVNCDTWWKIIDSIVVDHGTISPTAELVACGANATPHGVPGDGEIMSTNMAENNGQYIWYYFGPSHTLSIFTFVAGNLQDWGFGSLSISWPVDGTNSGIEASMIVIKDGFLGMAKGHAIVEIGRFGPLSMGIPLMDIVSDLSVRAGLTTGDIDVSELTQIVDGYMVTTRADARTDIDQLRTGFYFDAVEQQGKAVFINRGSLPFITIPDNDLAAQDVGAAPPPLLEIDRAQEIDLPVSVNVTYINDTAAWQSGSQQAIRQTVLAQSVADVQLAIGMNDQKARQVANVNLYEAWVERTSFKFITSRKYLYLEPTDVISARGYAMRIEKKTATVNGLVQFEAKETNAAIYTVGLTANPTSGAQQSVRTTAQPTNLLLLDLPLIQDTDLAQGIYAAAAGSIDQTWKGYTLYKSIDSGNTFNQVAAASTASVLGTVTAELGDYGGGNTVDEINQFEVMVGPGGGTLASVDLLSMLNGANTALVGNEIIQFRDATLTSPSVYQCAGLLRGRRGTEYAIPNHANGEAFILLPVTNVDTPFADLGVDRPYKAVTNGSSLTATSPIDFVDQGAALRPYSPVLFFGSANGSGDVTMVWTRRTRVGGSWADLTDVPLSEPSEQYVVQIWDSTFMTCARVVEGITSPTFLYTAAMQVTDFGATQQHIYATVGQLGSYGLGTQAKAIIDGGGGSDSAPLNPVTPYNWSPPNPGPPGGCPGTVINTTINWASPVRVFSGPDLAPGVTWLIKFTVGMSGGGKGWIAAAEYQGPPTTRIATLSTSPCGAPLQPSRTETVNTVLFYFYWGNVVNPHPTVYPTLVYGETYYLSITNQYEGSGMYCDLSE